MSTSIDEPGRSARLNMRISPEALGLLRGAADRQQQDLTAFVLGAAMERARAVLLEEQVLRLSPHAVLQLERALEAGASPAPQLIELIKSVRSGTSTHQSSTAAV